MTKFKYIYIYLVSHYSEFKITLYCVYFKRYYLESTKERNKKRERERERDLVKHKRLSLQNLRGTIGCFAIT